MKVVSDLEKSYGVGLSRLRVLALYVGQSAVSSPICVISGGRGDGGDPESGGSDPRTVTCGPACSPSNADRSMKVCERYST